MFFFYWISISIQVDNTIYCVKLIISVKYWRRYKDGDSGGKKNYITIKQAVEILNILYNSEGVIVYNDL